jgi:hypothetical protein
LIKYSLIFFLLLLSYSSLLIGSIFGINYLKVSLNTHYPININNYFIISNLVAAANSFVLSNNTQTKMSDSILPEVNDSNTFSTNGFLSSVLFPNYDILLHNINDSYSLLNDNNLKKDKDNINSSLYEFPKLISGTWVLNVTQGNVTNFYSVFKLVSSDGLEKHFLEINNFQNSDTNTSIILNPYTYTILNGYADIKIDDQLFESHLPLKIELNRINTIIISMNKQSINDLLFDNPIYGVVDSFKNFKNDELLILNNR